LRLSLALRLRRLALRGIGQGSPQFIEQLVKVILPDLFLSRKVFCMECGGKRPLPGVERGAFLRLPASCDIDGELTRRQPPKLRGP